MSAVFPWRAAATPDAVVAALFVATAMVLGGGGSPAPVPELALEWLALGVLAWALMARGDGRSAGGEPLVRWGAVAIVALPLLQLVPLLPGWWHVLPGRGDEVRALALVGQASSWRPWSIDPPATLASALSLIPPLAALFLVVRLRAGERPVVLAAVAATGLLASLAGALQVAGVPGPWQHFYQPEAPGLVLGFQANRNHAGDVFLIALLALAALLPPVVRRPAALAAFAAAAALLALSTVLTRSRAATLLLAVVLVAGVAWALLTHRRASVRARVVGGGVAAAVLVAAAALATGNAALRVTLDRYAGDGDGRVDQLWPDSWYAAGRLGWLGAGLGTFRPVQAAAERLDVVDDSLPNRAHDEFLELLIEYGAIGPLLPVAVAAWAGWRVVRPRRVAGKPDVRSPVVFGAGTLGLLLAHSTVDYPVRTMSLAVLAAVAVGMLTAPATGVERGSV